MTKVIALDMKEAIGAEMTFSPNKGMFWAGINQRGYIYDQAPVLILQNCMAG